MILSYNSLMENSYIIGNIDTPAGKVPQVATRLNRSDILNTIRVRWSIGRMRYTVIPGLYAAGNPTDLSDVYVTANYKLSFDHLRKNLDGIDAWILVLDTKGINVWCAAGKGTFGTKELVNRMRVTRLDEIISHRRIIVPQLGAVGISAHEVKKLTGPVETGKVVPNFMTTTVPPAGFKPNGAKIIRGFQVVFGPVKAEHIKEFIGNKYVVSPEMRRVTFTLSERATLIPVDFVYGLKKLLFALVLFILLSGFDRSGISFQAAVAAAPAVIHRIVLAYFAGIVLTPLALPYIPGRSFALKGFISGALFFLIALIFLPPARNFAETVAWFMIMTSVSSFMAMNFTGSSTYTSLSGVKKEMKVAVPLQVLFAIIGLILFIVSRFL